MNEKKDVTDPIEMDIEKFVDGVTYDNLPISYSGGEARYLTRTKMKPIRVVNGFGVVASPEKAGEAISKTMTWKNRNKSDYKDKYGYSDYFDRFRKDSEEVLRNYLQS